ncbi:MAG TPA: protein kinase, partial [Planctomycetota bacterium]|nr:protein kinase [Planctomycetota bacterium]
MSGPEDRPIPSAEVEAAFALYLARLARGQQAHFDSFCAERPALADALHQLHERWTAARRELRPPSVESAFASRLEEHFGAQAGPQIMLEAEPEGGDAAGLEHLRRHAEATRERYVLRGEIARGGMGAIIKVWDTDLRRPLAMKVMLGEERGGAGADRAKNRMLRRFLEEAQITGQLDHPGVVPVHELGIDAEGQVYFTMRLVKGRDFESVIELARSGREGWSQARALSTLLRICETMAYAHSKGVVHRDLKPANIMVGRFGETYVMDWGLARLCGREEGAPSADSSTLHTIISVDQDAIGASDSRSPLHTQEGSVMGTPFYIPREQALGKLEEIGPHSDVYSVGCMLYQLLSGRRPYAEPGVVQLPLQILRRIQEGPPAPLEQIEPDLPPELVAISRKAMAWDWHRRYPSMQEMADDLRAFLEGRVVSAYETGALAEFRKWIRRNKAIASALGGLVLVVLASLGAFAWMQRNKLEAVRGEQARTAQARDAAEANELAARESEALALRQSYFANVAAADASLRAGEVREAKRLLQDSPAELRGWEWRHLALRADAASATLTGHADRVTALAVAPSGALAASGSADRTVRIWDLAGDREPLVLAGHEDAVIALWFDARAPRLYSFGGPVDGRMRTWDTASGELVAILDLPVRASYAIALSSDASRVAIGAADSSIRVVDAATGQELRTLEGHERAVLRLTFSADGARLASGGEDGTVRVWDMAGENPPAVLEGNGGAIWALAFAPGASELAAGSEDGTVRRWNLERNELAGELKGHSALIYDLTYDAEGARLLSASFDKTLRLWDLASGETRAVLRGHEEPVRCAAFVAGIGAALSCSEDRTLRLWDLKQADAVLVHRPSDEVVTALSLGPRGERVLVGAAWNGAIEIVEAQSGEVALALAGDGDAVNAVAFSPDGARFAAGYEERATVALCESASGRVLATFTGHEASVTSVSFSPDGSRVASASTDRTARVWESDASDAVLVLPHEQPVRAVAYSPDGSRIATGSDDGQVRIWDAVNGADFTALSGHRSEVLAVAFSPDGKLVASASSDGT